MPSRWGNTSRHARGYGAAWVKLRAIILKRDGYLCVPCKGKGRVSNATSVDHIKPKAKGGTDDPANLQSICSKCREAKDAADRGASLKPKVRIGEDGWPV
jgi:5-methylcytosine-specific restriction protein A